MVDTTDSHPFTFRCYRADETPEADGPFTSNPTAVTDGGVVRGNACPTCEGALANVQGVPACTQCTWTSQ